MNEEQLIANFIHNPQVIETLGILLDKRIDELKEQLVTCAEDRLKGIQNAIAELNRFKSIKDTVLAKRKNNG